MDIRKICPAAVNGVLSMVSQTQPVPSIAACFAGLARTAKMGSAGALMGVVALTLSSAMELSPQRAEFDTVQTSARPATSLRHRHRPERSGAQGINCRA